MWTGIDLSVTRELKDKVRKWSSLEMPKQSHVTRLAREAGEDPEYVELLFQEQCHQNKQEIVTGLTPKERRFVKRFSSQSDRWLARRMGLSTRAISEVRKAMGANTR